MSEPIPKAVAEFWDWWSILARPRLRDWRGLSENQIGIIVDEVLPEVDRRLTALAKRVETAENCVDALETHNAKQSAEIARLREMIETARDAIACTSPDTFGSVPETHDHPGHWIRDELVDRLTKALPGKEE